MWNFLGKTLEIAFKLIVLLVIWDLGRYLIQYYL